MNKIIFTLLISLLLIPLSVDAQRRTTSVKGYTRKDGTYVKPHTRSYKSSSSSSASYSSNSNSDDSYFESELIAQLVPDSDKMKSNIDEISSQEMGDDSNYISQEAFYVDVYVLRYNDIILDILADPRGVTSFDPEYQFHKDKIPSDIVIDLVSNYGWSLRSDIVSKKYYSFSSDKDPKYLTRKKERIQIN